MGFTTAPPPPRCELHSDEEAPPRCRWCPLPADQAPSAAWPPDFSDMGGHPRPGAGLGLGAMRVDVDEVAEEREDLRAYVGDQPPVDVLRAQLREACEDQGVPMIGTDLEEGEDLRAFVNDQTQLSDEDGEREGLLGRTIRRFAQLQGEWAGQVERVRDERDYWMARTRRAEGMLRQISNLVIAGERRLGRAAVMLADWRRQDKEDDGDG